MASMVLYLRATSRGSRPVARIPALPIRVWTLRAMTCAVLGSMLGLAGCSSGSRHSGSTGAGSDEAAGRGGMQSSGSSVDASPSGSGVVPGNFRSGSGGMNSGGSRVGDGSSDVSGDGGADDSGSGEAGPGGVPPETQHPDLGKGDGSDVVLMGDSLMSNTLEFEGTGGGVAPALMQIAGQPYRNYAVQGVKMLQADIFGPAIPTQYEMAKQINPDIKTVVMTGGGNDILQNPTLQASCQMDGDECQQELAQISQAFDNLWTEMAGDGVQDVVYIQYPDNVGTFPPNLRGGDGPPSICFSALVRCHAVDTTAAVMSQIAADGIHPLQAANQRVAVLVYDLMVQDGMRR